MNQGDFSAGRKLFHDIGCIACHSPRNEQEKEIEGQSLKSLAHVKEKYSPSSLSEFLFDPHLANPSGRMPDMKLSKDESSDLAAYLVGEKVSSIKPFEDKQRTGDQRAKILSRIQLCSLPRSRRRTRKQDVFSDLNNKSRKRMLGKKAEEGSRLRPF